MARARSQLPHRMRAHVLRLVRARSRVLVALSGGIDSVVLLHLLRFHTDCDVAAAHFDHAMRSTSGADALWVRGLCGAWDVPLQSARAEDAPQSEAAARELRYEFLLAAADVLAVDAILTAHHADDQAETVLLRLARGTGLPGVAGIPARRGIIVRPLLPFTRAELEAYAAAHRLRWREDATNRELRYVRNRIRHRVLPELERVYPGATRRIARLARAAAEAEHAWRGIVTAAINDVVISEDTAAFVLARDRLFAYDPHVRARVMRHLLDRLGSRPDRAGTRFALSFISSGASGGGVELSGGIRLEREFDRLILRPAPVGPQEADVSLRIADAGPGIGTFVAGGLKFAAQWTPTGERAGAGHAARFDPSSLRFPLELRAWRAGDRIRLPYGSKKLKNLFRERRLARGARARVPVLCDEAGAVLWAVGVARSMDARPVPGGPVLVITVSDGDTE
ncbi:MAG TPA: tRNA lysidine(34) synthetase TilS [Longimicrobiales bacterium]